jgi:Fe-S cluster biogenesis protein NfuA
VIAAPARRSAIDPEELARAVEDVCLVMKFHGGAIEVVEVGDAGVVDVRFLGMCQGCPIRPLTLHGTIIPRIGQVPGVTEVRARGVRIADETAGRLIAALGEA